MARIHWFSFMQDATGLPIEGADVSIFLAGTNVPAEIYTGEIGGLPISEDPQLKTNALGFFEFWIADSSDAHGYSNSQKFKIVASRVGVSDIMIDYVDILCSIQPVDFNSDDDTMNKAISNRLAKRWNDVATGAAGFEIFGISEVDTSIPSSEKNKLVSNDLVRLWQDHRKMNFNENISIPILNEEDMLPWEDLERYPDLYGAHGLQVVQVSGIDRSDTVKNKLVSNALANKWEEHVNYSFKEHDISAPDFNETTPHGLRRANFAVPTFNLEDPNAPFELVKEYNDYNKLVSNRLIRELMYDSEIKASVTVRFVSSNDWRPSMYEKDIWTYSVVHNLNTKFVGVSMFRKLSRVSPSTGAIEVVDNMFSPEDVFLLSNDMIEIHSSRHDDSYVIVWGRKDLLKAMNETSEVSMGTGQTNKYRIIFRTDAIGGTVKFSGKDQRWWSFNDEVYFEPGEYILEFGDIEGYITPEPMYLDLRYNRLIDIEYIKRKYPVVFDVNIPNQQVRVISASGNTNDIWHDMDSEIEIENGIYVLEYSEAPGYATPTSKAITMNGKKLIIVVKYNVLVPHYKITFNSNVNNATIQLVDTVTNTSSVIIIYDQMVLTVPEGNYNIIFGDVSGMTTPAPQLVDLIEDKTISVEWEMI